MAAEVSTVINPGKTINFLSQNEVVKAAEALRVLYNYELNIQGPVTVGTNKWPRSWASATIYQIKDGKEYKSIGTVYDNDFASAVSVLTDLAPTLVSDLLRTRELLKSADHLFSKQVEVLAQSKNDLSKMCDENAALVLDRDALKLRVETLEKELVVAKDKFLPWGEDGA